MTALQQLERYLSDQQRRFRLSALCRGLGISAASALVLTLALTWFANLHRFAAAVVLPLRLLLFAAVACIITASIAVPVARLERG